MAQQNYYLSREIGTNIKDEWDAIDGYYDMLGYGNLEDSDRDIIIGIIEEEKKHARLLTEMAKKYDGGIMPEKGE